MALPKMDVLKLYKELLKEGSKFSSYNFRMYALRRIRSRFKESKHITDPVEIEFYYKDGIKNLEIVKRQVIVNNLYKTDKLVIENSGTEETQ